MEEAEQGSTTLTLGNSHKTSGVWPLLYMISMPFLLGVIGAEMWLLYGIKFGAAIFVLSALSVLLFLIGIARGRGSLYRDSLNGENSPLHQDERVWSFSRKYPSLLVLSFAMDIIAVIVGCVLFFLSVDSIHTAPMLIAAIYGSLFAGFSIFVMGYLMIAEWMQRFVLHRSGRSIFRDLFFDYLKSIPLVIVFSVIGLLFLLSGKQNNARNNIRRSGLYALFVAFKAYTYINLALLALRDEKGWMSYKEAKDILLKDPGRFAWMWFINGATLVPLGLLLVAFGGWMGAHPANTIVTLLFLVVFFSYMLFLVSMEQLAFLLYFSKESQDSAAVG